MSRLFLEYLKHVIRANDLLIAPGNPAVCVDFYGDPRQVPPAPERSRTLTLSLTQKPAHAAAAPPRVLCHWTPVVLRCPVLVNTPLTSADAE